MTVELTGSDLTLDEVVRVARSGERVSVAARPLERMRERRAIVEEAVASDAAAYGVTTGVGMRRDVTVAPEELAAFNRAAISGHLVGLGPHASEDVVRAALLRLANGLVAGFQGARPELAQALVDALNDGPLPSVRVLGTVGQADLAQNADLAAGALGSVQLEAGEAVALLSSSAFSTGQAALAVADARAFLESVDAAACVDYEAFRANVDALHEEVARARPYPGIRETLVRLRRLLEGSDLWEPGAARFLQDPLTFRCLPQLHGAARDALAFAEGQLAIELNAHQGNPLVVPEERRLVSVGNFDSQPLATALDLVRMALAPVLTAALERTLKLLSPRFSGLSEGL
ncbi:MAG: aromatic amino acid lyase, partial [Gaiellaceae bacterium]|nr:aromatic amino acid lyase [Gaiellaceae bacterium]